MAHLVNLASFVSLLFMFFLSLCSPLGLFHFSSFFLITNCVSLLLMVYFVGHWIHQWLEREQIYYYNWTTKAKTWHYPGETSPVSAYAVGPSNESSRKQSNMKATIEGITSS